MRSFNPAKQIATWTLMGLGVGGVLAAVGFFSRMRGSFLVDLFPSDLSAIEWLWVGLSYPARLLFRLWVGLRLPPRDDVLVVLILPSVAVLIQWTFLGFLVGLWRCRKPRIDGNCGARG